jgi:hypothetical protein
MEPTVQQGASLPIARRVAPRGFSQRQRMLLHEWIASIGPPLLVQVGDTERDALIADVTRP